MSTLKEENGTEGESQAIGPPLLEMFSPEAEGGTELKEDNMRPRKDFPVSELVWRDCRLAFPAYPLWLVACWRILLSRPR